MQKSAAEPHYNGERYIGIDTDILKLPNIQLIDGDMQWGDKGIKIKAQMLVICAKFSEFHSTITSL